MKQTTDLKIHRCGTNVGVKRASVILRSVTIACLKGLVTNYGEWGATKREEGAREVVLLRKKGGGTGKVLAMLKGGAQKELG